MGMATIDVPLAYLHAVSDEEAIILLNVILVDLLVNIYHKLCRKYFVLEKGFKVLYVKLQSLYMDYCAVHFCFTSN